MDVNADQFAVRRNERTSTISATERRRVVDPHATDSGKSRWRTSKIVTPDGGRNDGPGFGRVLADGNDWR